MRFEQLEYLIEIQNQGSISAAAKSLHLSHQALSISIKNLEDELGLLLLRRSVRGVSLTDEAKELVAVSKNFMYELDKIIQKFQLNNLQGQLSIAGTALSMEVFLPKAIILYYQKYPHVLVSSIKHSPSDTLSLFVDAQVDLGFSVLTEKTEKEILRDYPQIKFHHCTSSQTGAIISNKSSLANKKSLSLNNLKKATVIFNCAENIAVDPSNADIFQTISSQRKIYEPNPGIYRELLRNNVGIGITSLYQGQSMGFVPEETIFLPIHDLNVRYFGYFVHSQRTFSPLAQSFLTVLESIFL